MYVGIRVYIIAQRIIYVKEKKRYDISICIQYNVEYNM